MINSFKNFIELALNKYQMGKPSPSEFNHAIAESQMKNYSEKAVQQCCIRATFNATMSHKCD